MKKEELKSKEEAHDDTLEYTQECYSEDDERFLTCSECGEKFPFESDEHICKSPRNKEQDEEK